MLGIRLPWLLNIIAIKQVLNEATSAFRLSNATKSAVESTQEEPTVRMVVCRLNGSG